MLMPSSIVDVWSMFRASAYWLTIEAYSLFEPFEGLGIPLLPQMGLEILVFSPKSVRAMMFLVFSTVSVLLVTHTSSRLISIPVVTLGSVFMAASYLSRKNCDRKKWRFSS